MIGLNALFWVFVVLFAAVGAMRGWAKELLVTLSMIVAVFLILLMEQYVPFMQAFIAEGGEQRQLTVRAALVVLMVFFGYQIPKNQHLSNLMMRERIQDSLLGIVIGVVNGYLIAGTLLYYIHTTNYPFPFMTPSPPEALAFISYMPPAWLGIPAIYFALAIVVVFVMVVIV